MFWAVAVVAIGAEILLRRKLRRDMRRLMRRMQEREVRRLYETYHRSLTEGRGEEEDGEGEGAGAGLVLYRGIPMDEERYYGEAQDLITMEPDPENPALVRFVFTHDYPFRAPDAGPAPLVAAVFSQEELTAMLEDQGNPPFTSSASAAPLRLVSQSSDDAAERPPLSIAYHNDAASSSYRGSHSRSRNSNHGHHSTRQGVASGCATEGRVVRRGEDAAAPSPVPCARTGRSDDLIHANIINNNSGGSSNNNSNSNLCYGGNVDSRVDITDEDGDGGVSNSSGLVGCYTYGEASYVRSPPATAVATATNSLAGLEAALHEIEESREERLVF